MTEKCRHPNAYQAKRLPPGILCCPDCKAVFQHKARPQTPEEAEIHRLRNALQASLVWHQEGHRPNQHELDALWATVKPAVQGGAR